MKGFFFIFCSLVAAAGARADGGVGALGETSVLGFHLSIPAPQVGQAPTLFIEAHSEFSKNEIVVSSATLDGAALSLTKTGGNLWYYNFPTLGLITSHLISANVGVRDAKESKRIEDAITAANQDLVNLAEQLANTTDPTQRQAIQTQITQKTAYVASLQASLASLIVPLDTETFSFIVSANPQNTSFPSITSLVPSIGGQAGGTSVDIKGRSFPSAPVVTIGGARATVVSSTGTDIMVLTPAFTSTGPQDVVVSFPSAVPATNAILASGFYVSGPALLKNLKPVAVAPGYQKVAWPHPPLVTLDGSSSYDENGDTLSYTWKVVTAPKQSKLVPGAVLATQKVAAFTPDFQGFFVFSLSVAETSTPDHFVSFPSYSTVEVSP